MAPIRTTATIGLLYLLFISAAEAQKKCYQCFGLGATSPLLAQQASQYPISSCDDVGKHTKKIDCNGNCFRQNFTVSYDFQKAGIPSMDVDYLNLGCAARSKQLGCSDFNALPNIEDIRKQTENVVVQIGGRVTNMEGEACFCAGGFCNGAPRFGAKNGATVLVTCLAASIIKAFLHF